MHAHNLHATDARKESTGYPKGSPAKPSASAATPSSPKEELPRQRAFRALLRRRTFAKASASCADMEWLPALSSFRVVLLTSALHSSCTSWGAGSQLVLGLGELAHTRYSIATFALDLHYVKDRPSL